MEEIYEINYDYMEEIVVIGVCLVLNAMFAAYEMAFVSVSRPELRRLAKNGNQAALKILGLRESPERTLSIIQIGITLVGAISAAVGGAGAAESIVPYLQSTYGLSENVAESIAILLVVLPLSYLSVVVGELVPKSIALRNPVKITLSGARVLFMADRALSPAVTALEWSTKHLLHIFFPKSRVPAPPIETSIEIDSLPHHHQQAVLNLAHIERRKLNDILVPWKDVVCARLSEPMEEVVPTVFASGHTRLPIIENDKVVGVLHTKEFLALRESGIKEWSAILRPILRVRVSDSLLGTLRLMQSKRSHMAVVSSSSGASLGIVTFEDISEEIWGELFDEDEDSRIRRIFADRVKSRFRPPQ